MTMVARAGEVLARGLNRRTVFKRAAAATFGAFAAWTVQGFRASPALAGHCAYVTAGDCSCNPPYGQYCLQFDASYCSGATCSGGCTYDESYRYVGGCWCSATCEYTDESGYAMYGHYQCCDCNCYGTQCACREFIQGSYDHDDAGDPVIPVEPPAGTDNAPDTEGPYVPTFPNQSPDSEEPAFPNVPPGFPTPPPGFPFND